MPGIQGLIFFEVKPDACSDPMYLQQSNGERN